MAARKNINRLCDYHIHSRHSSGDACEATVGDIIKAAGAAGLASFGISNHLHIPRNIPDLEAARSEFDSAKTGAGIHFGVEVTVVRKWHIARARENGEWNPREGDENSPLALCLTQELAGKLDIEYVIGGAHWTLGAPISQSAVIRAVHSQHLFLAGNPMVDIIAHPWIWLGPWWKDEERDFYPGLPWFGNFSDIPEYFHEEFAGKVLENNKLVEINVPLLRTARAPGSFREKYLAYLVKLKDAGVRFTLGSDAHRIENIGSTLQITGTLEDAGITSECFGNPLDKSG